MARARELAPDGPLGVNVQLAPPTPATGERARILEVIRPFRRELGLPDEPPEPAARRALRPRSSRRRSPRASRRSRRSTTRRRWPRRRARAGAHLLPMVTTVDEARRAVALRCRRP